MIAASNDLFYRGKKVMVSVAASNDLLMVSVVARERFLMVSVVAGNVSFYVFRRWLFYGFRRGKERLLWFPSLVFYVFRLLQDRGCLSDGNRKKRNNRTFPRRTKYIYIYINIYI